MRVTHYERMHDCTRMHGATYSQSAAYHKNNYEKKKRARVPYIPSISPPIAVLILRVVPPNHHFQNQPIGSVFGG